MTSQPVRLSLWHLWDTALEDLDRESDATIDRSVVSSPAPAAEQPKVLGTDRDLIMDWPIPQVGCGSGSLWKQGSPAPDFAADVAADFAAAVATGRPDRAQPAAEPLPLRSAELEPNSDAIDWSLPSWASPIGLVKAAQTLPSRSIQSLRHWPSHWPNQWPNQLPNQAQVLDGWTRSWESPQGQRVAMWADRVSHHPLSKPALLLALPWGGAALAMQSLAGVPGTGACQFNPLPLSDLDQLHCAREQMRSQEPTQVIQGFRRLRNWSPDQQLYPVAERQLQSWSALLLGLARHQFDQGNWQEAQALLAEIPESSAIHGEAQRQKAAWQAVQSQGEFLLAEAKSAIAAQRWQAARRYAQHLASLSNDYWRTQGLKTLPNQIASQLDRRTKGTDRPTSAPPAIGSMPWIPPRSLATPEFSIA
jgi:hypothetical protein